MVGMNAGTAVAGRKSSVFARMRRAGTGGTRAALLTLGAAMALAGGRAAYADGDVVGWGNNDQGQCTPPAGLGSVTQIAGGGRHTIALKSDGTVACWGYNEYGQCNTPPGLASVTQIAAGYYHTIALKSDGTVACWGYDGYGQCNTPAGLASVTQIAGGEYHTIALKSNGTVACWGYNTQGQCTTPAGLPSATRIAGGGRHTIALTCAAPTQLRNSGNLGPVGTGVPRSFTFHDLPAAASAVLFTVRARSDLSDANEYLVLGLDGGSFVFLFGETGSDCPAQLDQASHWMSMKQFNGLVADGEFTATLTGSGFVNAASCASIPGACEIELFYVSVSVDCNNDGIEDSCEIDSGAPDIDGDGRLDACEVAQGDFNLDGEIGAADLAELLSLWGSVNPPYGDLNDDGAIGAQDLAMLLDRWGPLY